MGLTPAQARLRARIAAHSLHSQRDSKEITAKARAAFRSKFEREVDPDGTLLAEERQRRADHARRAHMARLALKAARARSRQRGQPKGDGAPTPRRMEVRHDD